MDAQAAIRQLDRESQDGTPEEALEFLEEVQGWVDSAVDALREDIGDDDGD